MHYGNILEEELKNKVAQDYFEDFDTTRIIGKIDFCVSVYDLGLIETQSLLWAEAKKGSAELYTALVQLILTIGKARTFDSILPPPFLAAFDAEKIAFLPYNDIYEIFYQNDFNWNVAPSNHETKEFKQVFEAVKNTIEAKALRFFFGKDDAELKAFIAANLVEGNTGTTKVKIDKNNFITIFNKWVQDVKPTIVMDWARAKKKNIIPADFYLADLLAAENKTLKEKLFVVLEENKYELDKHLNDLGMFDIVTTKFNDGQKAHHEFWKKYERPPKEEYWDYIVERRDLLVPQDIRERKGSFFTPQIWVELSQKYLADTLGQDWQDEYYIWDCAAGTGNLLVGLTNKYHIWASTLDKQDVAVMHDRIQHGANLLEKHVFQFDFLNDDFDKLPEGLREIVNDPEKRKKLVIYINPPYVEGDSRIGRGRKGVQESKVHNKYQSELGRARAELYTQFLMRMYKEIRGCVIGQFSTLKHLQASNFAVFRQHFTAKLEKTFIVPANTFDNVKGQFPIAFMVWNTDKEAIFKKIEADIFDAKGEEAGTQKVYSYHNMKLVSTLIEKNKKNGNGNSQEIIIGNMSSTGNDFQNQNAVFIEHFNKRKKAGGRHTAITQNNLLEVAIYFAVRKVIPATWLNDREQFIYPKSKKWHKDKFFHTDCLAFTLFKNNIQSEYGINHWIPFREAEVDAKERFKSNFMTDFISGKIQPKNSSLFAEKKEKQSTPLQFSPEAEAVFAAGKALWTYYHQQPNVEVNASLYDIRAYFQGQTANGRMKSRSEDETYTELLEALREKMARLAKKIAPKVYEYGFLLR